MTHILDYRPGDYWGFSYYNRVWAIPTSGLILFAGYELLKSKQYKLSITALVAMLLLSIPSIYYEFNINQQQASLNTRMKKLVKDKPGCHILTKKEWEDLIAGSFIPTWSFAHLSLLYNDTTKITSVLNPQIFDFKWEIIDQDQCHPYQNKIRITDPFTTYTIPINRRLDFSQIFKDQPQ